MTDDYKGYIPFKKLVTHQTVNHSQKQYVDSNKHANTIGGFWAISTKLILTFMISLISL